LSTWSRNNRLPALATLALTLMAAAIALIFFYAPLDQDGLNQKIFYFHVPIAFTAYACFGWVGGRRCGICGSATRTPTSRATSQSTWA
jgi:hypothetical protein